MALREKQRDGATILYPRGYFMGGPETDELEKRLGELLDGGKTNVIINLKDTEFLNSTALSALIKAHIRFSKAGAKIRLCHVDKGIKNVFVITKLVTVFDIDDDEDKAVAGF